TLDNASPNGETPTAAAIKAAMQYFAGSVDNDGYTKYFVLATDGEPSCGTTYDDNAEAVKAIADAAAGGFHTFVVGIGNDSSDQQVLSDMAMAGKEPNTAAGQKPYYQVSSTQALVDVLTKIAGQLVSCSYALKTPPTTPDLVTIQANNTTIPRDPNHMNG